MIPNADITIYNRYIDGRTEKYKRSVVRNVVWQSQKGIASTRFRTPTNTALVLIPFACGTQYATPVAWKEFRTGWTLQEGDIIVRGILTQELTTEYQPSNLRADYDNVMTIVTVDAMDQGSPNMQHWEVGCK